MAVILLILTFFVAVASAQEPLADYVTVPALEYTLERDIDWVFWSTLEGTHTNLTPERVNIDLSLDGGSTWSRRIAHGVPTESLPVTNRYAWSARITPALWSEQARIAVRTLWSCTTNVVVRRMGDASDEAFTIAGCRIVEPTPGAQIFSPSYVPVRWQEAGADYVSIGVSTNGIDFEAQAYVQSPGHGVNEYFLPITPYRSGSLWICVQALSNVWSAVRVNVVSVL